MSMNTPQQPQPQDNTPMEAATAPQPEVASAEQTVPVEQTAPVDTTPAPATEGQPTEAQEQQVLEGVAQGLADDEITAEDIMTAVLSDALGITPQGAQSLFRLLMSELVDEEETPKKEVPPQEGV